MNAIVENDSITLDNITEADLAKLRAATRRVTGKARPTKADMMRVIMSSVASFLSEGLRQPRKRGGAGTRRGKSRPQA